METLYMRRDARKTNLIHAILNMDNEETLSAIQAIVDEYTRNAKIEKPDFSDIVGIMTDEEAEAMKKVIKDHFEYINPNAWK
jgi:hypothetical protein